MKKAIFIAITIFLSTYLFGCVTIWTAETKTFTGRVDLVFLGDATERTCSEIVVVADNGEEIRFRLKSDITIINKDGTVIALKDLKRGSEITVDFTKTKMGTCNAQYIRVLK